VGPGALLLKGQGMGAGATPWEGEVLGVRVSSWKGEGMELVVSLHNVEVISVRVWQRWVELYGDQGQESVRRC